MILQGNWLWASLMENMGLEILVVVHSVVLGREKKTDALVLSLGRDLCFWRHREPKTPPIILQWGGAMLNPKILNEFFWPGNRKLKDESSSVRGQSIFSPFCISPYSAFLPNCFPLFLSFFLWNNGGVLCPCNSIIASVDFPRRRFQISACIISTLWRSLLEAR